MDVYLYIIQNIRYAELIGSFLLGALLIRLLYHYRSHRKKRVATGNMVDAEGKFLVVVGYTSHTHSPIEAYVYRAEVLEELHKEMAELRRGHAEAEKGHEATFAAIRELVKEED